MGSRGTARAMGRIKQRIKNNVRFSLDQVQRRLGSRIRTEE